VLSGACEDGADHGRPPGGHLFPPPRCTTAEGGSGQVGHQRLCISPLLRETAHRRSQGRHRGKETMKRKGVNAKAWFYAQSFHAPRVESSFRPGQGNGGSAPLRCRSTVTATAVSGEDSTGGMAFAPRGDGECWSVWAACAVRFQSRQPACVLASPSPGGTPPDSRGTGIEGRLWVVSGACCPSPKEASWRT
jgi:hypothetical protein